MSTAESSGSGPGLIVGVDGCRAGWVIASMPASGGEITIDVVPTLDQLLNELRTGAVHGFGIDMPIGLPETGPRACDIALRRFLGRRGSSVFPAPVRALLGLPDFADYRAACALSIATAGKSLSLQSFYLLPKIAEVDALLRPGVAERVVEVHPESAFAAMNAGAPLLTGKKTVAGRTERSALLAREFPGCEPLALPRLPGAAADDVLDAIAALWSTQRWLGGEAMLFGGDAVDSRGLPMCIAV